MSDDKNPVLGLKVFSAETMQAVLADAHACIESREELLARCAVQFRMYEASHRKKAADAYSVGMNGGYTPVSEKESLEKAEVNKKFAEEIEAMLKEKTNAVG